MQIQFDHGPSFPAPLRIGGGLFTLFGVIGSVQGSIFAMALLLVGIYILSTRTGIIIDPENRQFREYTQYFGIKTGKWVEMMNYPDLAVLRTKYTSDMMTRGMTHVKDSDVYFEVYMLTPRHRKRVLVSKHEDIVGAQEKAKELSATCGLNYVKFQPR